MAHFHWAEFKIAVPKLPLQFRAAEAPDGRGSFGSRRDGPRSPSPSAPRHEPHAPSYAPGDVSETAFFLLLRGGGRGGVQVSARLSLSLFLPARPDTTSGAGGWGRRRMRHGMAHRGPRHPSSRAPRHARPPTHYTYCAYRTLRVPPKGTSCRL